MLKTALLVSGGTLTEQFLKKIEEQEETALLIAVDGGLAVCKRAGRMPDFVIGDFDTVSPEILEEYRGKVPFLEHKPEKDETDTELAVGFALESGCKKLILCGATGSRLDHTLANLDLLKQILDFGAEGMLIDENNRITLHKESFAIEKRKAYGTYLSLLPFSDRVEDICLYGMKYPLSHAVFEKGRKSGLGVSNEIMEDEALVAFKKGLLLMIEAKDE